MSTRTARRFFNSEQPPADTACDVWAQDQDGEYRIPYACVWRDSAWYGVGKTKPLAIQVVGWHLHRPRPER